MRFLQHLPSQLCPCEYERIKRRPIGPSLAIDADDLLRSFPLLYQSAIFCIFCARQPCTAHDTVTMVVLRVPTATTNYEYELRAVHQGMGTSHLQVSSHGCPSPFCLAVHGESRGERRNARKEDDLVSAGADMFIEEMCMGLFMVKLCFRKSSSKPVNTWGGLLKE